MHGCVWRAGSAAIAIAFCTLPAGALAAARMIPLAQMVQLAQNASDPARATAAPSQPPAADAPAAPPANSPAQIKKAQIQLRRLACLTGPIPGQPGRPTRQALN